MPPQPKEIQVVDQDHHKLDVNSDGSINTFVGSSSNVIGNVGIVDPSGNQVGVCTCGSDYALYIHSVGEVDPDNSTSTPLGISGVYSGTAVEITNESVICVSVFADEDSAASGLNIQQSVDGINWDHSDTFTIGGGVSENYTINPHAQWYKIDYTNGTTGQSAFRMQSILKASYVKPSAHRVGGDISNQDDAELVKAVLSGENGDGLFHNVKTTADGNLTISDNSDGLAIAKGNVTGTSFIHKFGAAPDFDTGDGFVTVWDGAEDNEPYESMQYVYSTTADIDYLTAQSSNDTQLVEVQGLTSSYDLITQTKTLTGQTPVALDTPLIRVFRVKNIGSVDFESHVFSYVSSGTTVTNGVPQDGSKVRAVVHNGNNQTEMAVFTIPAGKTGYMRDWYASTAGAKRASSHTIRVLARPFGQVFQLKHTGNIDVNGTSYIKHQYIEPEKFTEKTDIEIRMDTDQNIAGVAAGFDIVLVDN